MLSLTFFRRDTPVLEGERVKLRFPLAQDYREWAALRRESREFLQPWEPRWAPDELERTSWRKRLRLCNEDFAAATSLSFLIFTRNNDRLLGGITLGNIRYGVAQSGQIGYWLGQRHAGQGYMVDAVRLLIPYAFDRLRLHRIEAACIPGNVRSVRVLEKAGFHLEGHLQSYLRINGCWQDHHLYALIAPDHGYTK